MALLLQQPYLQNAIGIENRLGQILISNIINSIERTHAIGPMCAKLGCYPIHLRYDFSYLTFGKPRPVRWEQAGYKLPVAGDFNYLALLNFMQNLADIVSQF